MITTDVFTDRLELHAYGRLTLDECREFELLSDYRIQFNGPLDLLLDLRELESCSLDALIEQVRYGRQHAHDFSRIAIVSDSSMVTWAAMCSQFFVDADVRVFDDEGMAREWLGVTGSAIGDASVDSFDQQIAH
ncbi:STAS/SEC14 domain-containing protein [Uliginosibacterium sp. H3]|uniref:STAS/SEC14 domain-containing protein n=1 Tax=Uliginosibacterium silvisoli TaxID=3114758 RepID=A0ABU6K6R9_9RHOO|nr:STAS/SEC14 domain-containing protein [Uliginosibacterium sp. H3]